MDKRANEVSELDPRGLIFESYRIDGISQEQCRSIFFDWAMGQNAGAGSLEHIKALLSHYTPEFPNHPMTDVLREGMGKSQAPRRRGGWRARRS